MAEKLVWIFCLKCYSKNRLQCFLHISHLGVLLPVNLENRSLCFHRPIESNLKPREEKLRHLAAL